MKTQAECMEIIRELLAEPVKTGNWWAKEIMELKAMGRPVTPFQLSVAERALKE